MRTSESALNFLNQPLFFCLEMHVTPTPFCAQNPIRKLIFGYPSGEASPRWEPSATPRPRLLESFVRVGLNGSGRLEPPEATPLGSSQADA